MSNVLRTDISSEEATSAIIAANGNTRLAAERLHTNEATLTLAIAKDPDVLPIFNAQIRAIAMVKLLRVFFESMSVFEANMADLEPGESVKAFSTIAALITQLTATPQSQTNTNINMVEVVLKQLPPEVRNAISTLATTPENVVEGVVKHQ